MGSFHQCLFICVDSSVQLGWVFGFVGEHGVPFQWYYQSEGISLLVGDWRWWLLPGAVLAKRFSVEQRGVSTPHEGCAMSRQKTRRGFIGYDEPQSPTLYEGVQQTSLLFDYHWLRVSSPLIHMLARLQAQSCLSPLSYSDPTLCPCSHPLFSLLQ